MEHKVRKTNEKKVGKKTSFHTMISDAISESSPRVIHEDRARKLAHELKRCTYYETCATYGLNVERVFYDGKFNKLASKVSSLIIGHRF